jgi:hypothetical protein
VLTHGLLPVVDAPSGLKSLVLPHLSQVMVLNFVGFVGLAVVLVSILS